MNPAAEQNKRLVLEGFHTLFKRLVRNATDTPLAQGLVLERNLFMKLCVSDQGLARMRSYEEKKISAPSRSIEI